MKTFKGLFITKHGVIKVGEFPVEPDYCTIGVQDQCEKRDVWVESLHCYTCSCRAKEVEHQQALASAKANAVVVEDQTLAATLMNGVKEGDVFTLPSGWDYRVEESVTSTHDTDLTIGGSTIHSATCKVAKLYSTDEKKPHGFCEKPNSTCTMNYCDENGCNERKRVLVEPEESQEEIWRKFFLELIKGGDISYLSIIEGTLIKKAAEKYTITRKP